VDGQNLGEEIGGTLGYSIRFESRVSEKTRIEVVTEGILTRRMQTDPSLEGVAMSSSTSSMTGAAGRPRSGALPRHPTHPQERLKILVMSATLDCGR